MPKQASRGYLPCSRAETMIHSVGRCGHEIRVGQDAKVSVEVTRALRVVCVLYQW